MSLNHKIIIISALVLLTSGCASAVKRVEAVQSIVNQPVDCANAQHTIADLLSQKPSSSERAVNTVASILPTSIILNLITGEFASRSSIAAGKLDAQISEKIMTIEQDCMLIAGSTDF